MGIILEAVQFNHDPNSASNDALTIWVDHGHPVTLPEWQRGVTLTPEESPAAYSLQETAGRTITIKARFSQIDSAIHAAEIRAIDFSSGPMNALNDLARSWEVKYL